MQSFGEYLKEYLEENSLSYSAVSKRTGIDRSVIAKYAKGLMKPKDQRVVIQIARGMEMTSQEEENLCKAYKQDKLCEKYGIHSEELEKCFAIKYHPLETKPMEKNFLTETECAKNIFTCQEIFGAVQYLVKDATFIKMRFRLDGEKMQEILKQKFFYESNCPIERIIILPKECNVEKKLKVFSSLCTSLFYMKEGTVYYQYGNHRKIGDKWMPDYIMTNKGILFIDSNLEYGFFSNQQFSCNFYKEKFDIWKTKCQIFAATGEKISAEFSKQYPDCVNRNEKTGISFSYTREEKIWIGIEKKQQKICVNELEVVELLKKLI